MTRRVLLLGTGHIGRAVAHLLVTAEGEPRCDVVVGDRLVDPEVRSSFPDRWFEIDGDDIGSFARRIQGCDIVINALPFDLAATVANAAAQSKAHYFDLTEDVSATRAVRALAEGAAIGIGRASCRERV